MQQLSSAQRQFLRKLAHTLKPVVQVGKNGMSESVFAAADQELDSHELIKIKFVDFQDQKRALAQELATRSKAELIGVIGNIAIVYRQNPDPEKRKIRLTV